MIKIEPDNMDVESFCSVIGCTTQEFNKRVKEIKRLSKILRCKLTEQECISFAKKSFFEDKMSPITIEEATESIQKVMREYKEKEC